MTGVGAEGCIVRGVVTNTAPRGEGPSTGCLSGAGVGDILGSPMLASGDEFDPHRRPQAGTRPPGRERGHDYPLIDVTSE